MASLSSMMAFLAVEMITFTLVVVVVMVVVMASVMVAMGGWGAVVADSPDNREDSNGNSDDKRCYRYLIMPANPFNDCKTV